MVSFNPLPPPKRGETGARTVVIDSLGVSIHSPRRSEGRHVAAISLTAASVFQSTPPAEARGDRRFRMVGPRGLSFNPLPPPKRGETCPVRPDVLGRVVSIHSPRRSEGRQASRDLLLGGKKFQSTPPAEARGDAFPVDRISCLA